MRFEPIGIVGAGAFGTALAVAAARAGRDVLLWARDASLIATMAETRSNPCHLPGIDLARQIRPVADLSALGQAGAILLTTPAQATREVARALRPVLGAGTPVVICAKGIERSSGAFPSAIVAEMLPQAIVALLSGPSFAIDIGRGLPTALVLACQDRAAGEALARLFSSSTLRVYHSADMRGVEIGGAAKNVLAIAAGIVEARQLGESAKAALIARGFAEMGRFARAWGGETETLMGLSGLGDLILTAGSRRSRNFSYGLRLGSGISPADAADGSLSEGAYTADILVALAEKRHVEMPICAAVADIVAGKISVSDAIERLVARPARAE